MEIEIYSQSLRRRRSIWRNSPSNSRCRRRTTLLQSLVTHLSSPLPSKNLKITQPFIIVFTIP
ncbi:hypothetical protein L195_g058855, partial [Trifolium pratense]